MHFYFSGNTQKLKIKSAKFLTGNDKNNVLVKFSPQKTVTGYEYEYTDIHNKKQSGKGPRLNPIKKTPISSIKLKNVKKGSTIYLRAYKESKGWTLNGVWGSKKVK